jgi:HEAT repeat protein
VAGVQLDNRATRWCWASAAALVFVFSASGCVNFWDDITSRDFKIKSLWTKPPPPMEIIEHSDDSALRAKALVKLKEPLSSGGSNEEQEFYLHKLTTAAKEDREPLCRLAAIRALGSYKDPRAVRALEDVYQQSRLPFNQDFNSMIRQQALASLEMNGDEETRHLLIRVARQPGPSNEGGQAQADRQQTQDEKLIAIRALGRYKQQDCIDTLVFILKKESDIALRDRAYDSLVQITGRKLPEDPEVLQAEMLVPGAAPEPNLIQRVSAWVTPK